MLRSLLLTFALGTLFACGGKPKGGTVPVDTAALPYKAPDIEEISGVSEDEPEAEPPAEEPKAEVPAPAPTPAAAMPATPAKDAAKPPAAATKPPAATKAPAPTTPAKK